MGWVVWGIEITIKLLIWAAKLYILFLYWVFVVPIRALVNHSGRRRRQNRPAVQYWTHQGCAIRHTRQDTAARCRLGRS